MYCMCMGGHFLLLPNEASYHSGDLILLKFYNEELDLSVFLPSYDQSNPRKVQVDIARRSKSLLEWGNC